jgi:pimeloyl-ACP methyl ester carboxylesterase
MIVQPSVDDAPGLECAEREIVLGSGAVQRRGWFGMPANPRGVVVFAHGSGQGSAHDESLARAFRRAGLATLRCDLLGAAELRPERRGGRGRYELDLLAGRIVDDRLWLLAPETRDIPVGYFGTGVGAAAALVAAAEYAVGIAAIVGRRARADLVGARLRDVRAPTLLLEESPDPWVLAREQRAKRDLETTSALQVVGAGALSDQSIARAAIGWYSRYFLPQH